MFTPLMKDKTLIDHLIHNEADVIRRLMEGEESAFNTVYDHFFQRVYFFARRFVSEAEAKDVTSEAFVQLWQRKETFTSLKGISNFLFVLVRNQCFNLLRRQVIKERKHADLLHLLETSEAPDLFVEQVRAALIRHIYAEVDKLPARMKEIFLLSFDEGLKPADIATRLQLSVQTVSNQKLSAIRLLKAALGERGPLLSLLLLCSAECGV